MEDYGSQLSQVENPSISQNRSIKAKLENSHLLHSVQNELSVIMSCDRASMVYSSTHHFAIVEARNDSDKLNYTIVNNHAHSNQGSNRQEEANDFKMKVLSIHTSPGSSMQNQSSSQNRYRNQQSGVQSTQILQQDSLKQKVSPQIEMVLRVGDQHISRQSTEKAPGASVVTMISPPTAVAQTSSMLQAVQTKYLCGGSGETAAIVSRQEAVGTNKESLMQVPMAVQSQPSTRRLEALLHNQTTKKLSNETVVISLQNGGGANPDFDKQDQEHLPKIQILHEESKNSDMFQSMQSRQMIGETPPSLNLRLSSSDIQGMNSGTHYQDSSSRGFSSNQRSQTMKRSSLISPNIIITRPPEEESKSSSMRRAPTWTPSNDESDKSDKSTRKNNNSKRRPEPPQQFKNRKFNNNDGSTDEDQFLKQLSRSINQANKQRSFSTKVNENQNTFVDGSNVYVVQDQISQSNLQMSSVLSVNPQKVMKRKHKNQPFVVRWVNDKLVNVKTGKVIGSRHGHHVDITSSTGQDDSSNVSGSQNRLVVQSPSNPRIMLPRMNQQNLHMPLAPIEERSGTSFTNSAAATTSANKVPVSPINSNMEEGASNNCCDNADVVMDCTPKSSYFAKQGTASAHTTPKYSQAAFQVQRVKILEEIREDDAEKDFQEHLIQHNKPFTQSKFRKRSSKVFTPQNNNLQVDYVAAQPMMSFTEMANNALQNSQINQQSRQNPLENNKQIDRLSEMDNTAQFINNGQKIPKSTFASNVSPTANELFLPQPDRSPESSQFIELKKVRRDSNNSKGKPKKSFNVEQHNLLQFEISKTKGLIKLVREAEIRKIFNNKSKTPPPPLTLKNRSGSVGKGILVSKSQLDKAQDAAQVPPVMNRPSNKRRSTVKHIKQFKEIPAPKQISPGDRSDNQNELLVSSPDDQKLYMNRKRRQSHKTTYQVVASKMLKQKSIILARSPQEGNSGSGTPMKKKNLDQKYSQRTLLQPKHENGNNNTLAGQDNSSQIAEPQSEAPKQMLMRSNPRLKVRIHTDPHILPSKKFAFPICSAQMSKKNPSQPIAEVVTYNNSDQNEAKSNLLRAPMTPDLLGRTFDPQKLAGSNWLPQLCPSVDHRPSTPQEEMQEQLRIRRQILLAEKQLDKGLTKSVDGVARSEIGEDSISRNNMRSSASQNQEGDEYDDDDDYDDESYFDEDSYGDYYDEEDEEGFFPGSIPGSKTSGNQIVYQESESKSTPKIQGLHHLNGNNHDDTINSRDSHIHDKQQKQKDTKNDSNHVAGAGIKNDTSSSSFNIFSQDNNNHVPRGTIVSLQTPNSQNIHKMTRKRSQTATTEPQKEAINNLIEGRIKAEQILLQALANRNLSSIKHFQYPQGSIGSSQHCNCCKCQKMRNGSPSSIGKESSCGCNQPNCIHNNNKQSSSSHNIQNSKGDMKEETGEEFKGYQNVDSVSSQRQQLDSMLHKNSTPLKPHKTSIVSNDKHTHSSNASNSALRQKANSLHLQQLLVQSEMNSSSNKADITRDFTLSSKEQATSIQPHPTLNAAQTNTIMDDDFIKAKSPAIEISQLNFNPFNNEPIRIGQANDENKEPIRQIVYNEGDVKNDQTIGAASQIKNESPKQLQNNEEGEGLKPRNQNSLDPHMDSPEYFNQMAAANRRRRKKSSVKKPGQQNGQEDQKRDGEDHLQPHDRKKINNHHPSTPHSITTYSLISSRKNGKKKINQYIFQQLLGEGKFSKVFKVYNEQDKKEYAMKVVYKKRLNKHSLLSHISKQKKAYNFLESEIAILKKLDHPNVLTLFEIIDDPNQEKLYIITDYIKGGHLGDRIKKSLSTDQIRSFFRGLIYALEYLHDFAHVMHRDIKPENILLDHNDQIKLADFGVSQLIENGDDTLYSRAGTTFFFCPEICNGSTYHGKPADVWAAGVVLYMMVAKKYPFNSQSMHDLIRLITKVRPDYSDFADEKLIDLLEGIFRKDPNRRFTISQIKEHPWMTDDGRIPMQRLKSNKITVNDQDLKQVVTKVVTINRVMKNIQAEQNQLQMAMGDPNMLQPIDRRNTQEYIEISYPK